MGLFSALLTLPLAPMRGVLVLGERLQDEAYRQWTDPGTVREQLAAVQAAYDAGEITAAERDQTQDHLVARLLTARGSR